MIEMEAYNHTLTVTFRPSLSVQVTIASFAHAEQKSVLDFTNRAMMSMTTMSLADCEWEMLAQLWALNIGSLKINRLTS
jgi:hypothetical protein